MAKTLVGALALASLPSALAFRNTSPFFLFSTADLKIDRNDVELATSTQIDGQVIEILNKCPSHTYLVVRQPGVSSTDYADGMPRLGSYLGGKNEDIKSSMIIPEVVGNVDADLISRHLERVCGAETVQIPDGELPPVSTRLVNRPVRVVDMTVRAPSKHRAFDMADRDEFLDHMIYNWALSEDYTVIYTTVAQTEAQAEAAQAEHTYEMEESFGDAVHIELKRDFAAHSERAGRAQRRGGNFEKYQFFTPGLFMGFTAVIPLVAILFVGLRAITGLEVSYFAFSKEMGPSAQRKQ